MKKITRIYLWSIILLGMGTLIGVSIVFAKDIRQILFGVIIMSALGAIAESQSVAIDESKAISIAVAINLSSLLLFGLPAAIIVAFATAFFSIMDYGRGSKEHLFNTPLYKNLFNSSNYILSITAAGLIHKYLSGSYLNTQVSHNLNATLYAITQQAFAIILGLVGYIFVNTAVLTMYFFFENKNKKTVLQDWFRIFRWSLFSMFAIGCIGILFTAVYHSYGILVVLLLFAPFMLLRYVFVGFSSIQKGYIDTINAFSSALEAKDEYTKGHSLRVSQYCAWIAEELKLSQARTRNLHYASLLHDIGKISIPENILNKKEKLTDEEIALIQTHPEIGAQMLENITFLQKEVRIIRAHHVRYDGKGYPQNVHEDSKMLETQILCVADSFDAMTTKRAYKDALTISEAIVELRACSGTQFSPVVVEALIAQLEKKMEEELDKLLHDFSLSS